MIWTGEELQSMREWDALIEESGWTEEDEEASRDISEILAPVLYRERIQDILDALTVPEPEPEKTYVAERRPGKGKRKSKGNVAAQRARYAARKKLRKQMAS